MGTFTLALILYKPIPASNIVRRMTKSTLKLLIPDYKLTQDYCTQKKKKKEENIGLG